jgi:hypothetical protein
MIGRMSNAKSPTTALQPNWIEKNRIFANEKASI